MNKRSGVFLFGLALVSSGPVWANSGHFAVDDAGIIPGGTCGLETWVSRMDSVNVATLNPSCNFLGGAQWSLPLTYNLENSELTHMGLEYKTVLWDSGRGPALAFDAGVNYSRVASQVQEYYINIPASFQTLENLTLHINVGAIHDRPASDTFAAWGLGATVKTVNGPNLIVEVADNDRDDPWVGAGARFGIGASHWTLDLGVARDTGPGENIYTLGLNSPSFF